MAYEQYFLKCGISKIWNNHVITISCRLKDGDLILMIVRGNQFY